MGDTKDGPAIYESCGTPSGYRRHLRNGTESCPGCKRAIADYMQTYRHDRGLSKGRLIPDSVLKKHGIKVGS
ncbi:hypothetical protein [Pseudarthrobacter sp. S9]|uniref:hypothetical protein n=1 Tax=Pseudarthrobacter sp. S9 TaxID=3418421 RepID=UPI003D075BE7